MIDARTNVVPNNARPTPGLLTVRNVFAVAAIAMLASACGGVQFERNATAKRYRALPLGTPVKVVASDAGLTQPVEEIGVLKLTLAGAGDHTAAAQDSFKASAAKYGCDAVVGIASKERKVVKKVRRRKPRKRVTAQVQGAAPAKAQPATKESVEHDFTARCVRTADAPKEVAPKKRRRRGRRTRVARTTTTKPAAATTTKKPSRSRRAARPAPTAKPTRTTAATTTSTRTTTTAGAGATVAAPRANNGDPKVASEVARAFLMFSKYMSSGNVSKICQMLDTERIYFDIRTKSPKLQIKVDLPPTSACASLKTGDLGSYIRDFGPAEVHSEIATLIPSLFRIHGGAYLRLDAAQEAAYSQKLMASRAGKKSLACTMYTVLPAGNLFKISTKCHGVSSYRLLLRRDGPDDFKLMAMTHVR